LSFILDVNVSLDAEVNVMEGAGSENICVTLMAAANTERSFIVELSTEAGTAIGKIMKHFYIRCALLAQ